MLKKVAVPIAILYTILLGVFSLIKISNLPETNISNSDKALHFIAYAILMWCWYTALFYKTKWHFNKTILIAAVFSIVFGIVIEVLQNMLTNTRVADYFDILANVLGVSVVVLILKYLNKTEVKKY
ncbi:MAG: VanZ family protein [Oceanihabitans sp.]